MQQEQADFPVFPPPVGNACEYKQAHGMNNLGTACVKYRIIIYFRPFQVL